MKGSWKTTNGPVAISLPVSSPTISEKIPKGATEVDLLLVNQTGDVLDYHRETQFWTLGQGRILPASPEKDQGGLVVIGEGPEAEREVMLEGLPKRVFIVHGHDKGNLLRLREILKERFGLEPVILISQPGKGRTLIEKFEQEAYQCAFAFVLMSPDDQVQVGRRGKKGKFVQARANEQCTPKAAHG